MVVVQVAVAQAAAGRAAAGRAAAGMALGSLEMVAVADWAQDLVAAKEWCRGGVERGSVGLALAAVVARAPEALAMAGAHLVGPMVGPKAVERRVAAGREESLVAVVLAGAVQAREMVGEPKADALAADAREEAGSEEVPMVVAMLAARAAAARAVAMAQAFQVTVEAVALVLGLAVALTENI